MGLKYEPASKPLQDVLGDEAEPRGGRQPLHANVPHVISQYDSHLVIYGSRLVI